MDMNKEDHIVTLPKKGLKTRPYNIGMEKRDLKTRPYSIDMEKKDLKKRTKGQLIKLLMNQRKKPNPPPMESVKTKPIPRKSVNEDIILPLPEQFQDQFQNQELTEHENMNSISTMTYSKQEIKALKNSK